MLGGGRKKEIAENGITIVIIYNEADGLIFFFFFFELTVSQPERWFLQEIH